MSDDRKDDGMPPDQDNQTTTESPAHEPLANDFASLLKALTVIEDAMVRSSSKMSALLSSIATVQAPWLSDANRFGTLSGETFAHGHDTSSGKASSSCDVKTWVEFDHDAPPGLGRIMLSWPAREGSAASHAPDGTVIQTSLPGVVAHDSPVIAGNMAIVSGRAANDNVIWVGDEHIDGSGGIFGREPSVATLADGHTVIAWIGEDNIVHAKLYPGEAESMSQSAHGQASTAAINAMLADLGEAAPANGSEAGRLKVLALDRGGFAAVWVAELGFTAALVGKAFLTPAATDAIEDLDASGQSAGWTIHDLPPVTVTGHDVSQIMIAQSGDDALQLSYTSTGESMDGAHAHVHQAVVDLPGAGADHGQMHGDAGLDHIDHTDNEMHHGAATLPAVFQMSQSRLAEREETDADKKSADNAHHDDGGSGTDDAKDDHHSTGIKVPVPDASEFALETPVAVGEAQVVVGKADDQEAQNEPQVATGDGKVHILSSVHDAHTGTDTLKITTLNDQGHQLHEVTVTKDAITSDASHPSLDLGPSLTAVGSGVGVAWVQNTTTAEGATVKEIAVQVYSEDGAAAGHTPTIVTLADNPNSTVSGISIAGIEHEVQESQHETTGTTVAHETAGEQPAAPQPAAELAIVWVKDSNAAGFGAINAQVFAIELKPADAAHSDGWQGLVALGHDCGAGGDDDKPFQLTDGGTPVIGRAPQAEGLHDGARAVTWVAPAASDTGYSVIKGVILDTSNGAQLQDLDLSGLMPNGVADGTQPELTSDDNGDIIVGWLQVTTTGGYDHDAAVYRRGDHGQWTPPTTTLFLAHFTNLPHDVSITVTSGTANPSLIVTYSDGHNDVTGARFDLDGNKLGNTFDIHHDNSGPGSGSGSPSSDGGSASVAALPDGQFIVVFTQAGGGGSDIGAQVFSTSSPADAHAHSGPDSIASLSVSITTPALPAEDSTVSPASLPALTEAIAFATYTPNTSGHADNGAGYSGGNSGTGSNGASDLSSGQSDHTVISPAADNSGSASGLSGAAADVPLALATIIVPIDFTSGQDGSGSGPAGSSSSNSSSSGPPDTASGPSDHSVSNQAIDNSIAGSGSSGPPADAVALPPMYTVHVDLASDQIHLLSANDSQSGTDSTAFSVLAFSGPTAQDVAITIETLTCPSSNLNGSGSPHLNGTSGSDGNSSSHYSGSDSITLLTGARLDDSIGSSGSTDHTKDDEGSGQGGGSSMASNDNFHFAKGFGGDAVAPEIHEETAAHDANPITEAFDALQFANALSATGNDDVIVFDTSNVVTIRSFNTMGHGDPGLM